MDRTGNQKLGITELSIPVAAKTVIAEAIMISIAANGYAVPASKKEGEIVAGCAIHPADNSNGADGAENVQVRRGAFVWNNDGSIKATDILKDCYVVDETTVGIASEGSSKAGRILAVEADGVTVEML